MRGLTAQLRADRRLIAGCYGIQAAAAEHASVVAGTVAAAEHASVAADTETDKAMAEEQLFGPAQGYSGKYKDDLTGQPLKDDLVRAARAKELEFSSSKGVWMKVLRRRAFERTGRPPISVRWVDVNKGDEHEPNYRSRLVARQLKATDMSGKSHFAAQQLPLKH